MQQKQLDGIATISENGNFSFDAGYPETEQILSKKTKQRGTLTIAKNANVIFTPDKTSVSVAPQVDIILRDKNLRIQRTTQNFIVTMKFPIVELPEETTESHKSMWKKSLASIRDSRAKIKESF